MHKHFLRDRRARDERTFHIRTCVTRRHARHVTDARGRAHHRLASLAAGLIVIRTNRRTGRSACSRHRSRRAARSQHALWRPANATASIMAPRSPSMQEETIWTGRRVAQHEMMTATHHVAIVPHQCPCASRNRRPRSAASAAACCRLRRLSVRPPHRALSVELSGDGTAVLVVGDVRDTVALV